MFKTMWIFICKFNLNMWHKIYDDCTKVFDGKYLIKDNERGFYSVRYQEVIEIDDPVVVMHDMSVNKWNKWAKRYSKALYGDEDLFYRYC